jgi:hypothetical protein
LFSSFIPWCVSLYPYAFIAQVVHMVEMDSRTIISNKEEERSG